VRRPARLQFPIAALALMALIVYPLVSNSLYYQNMLILTFVLAIGAVGWT